MSEAASGAYESLVTFLYRAPIALMEATLDGAITMATPLAMQLLLPLVPGEAPDDLYALLQSQAPALAAQARELPVDPAHAGLELRLEGGAPGAERKLLGLCVVRVDVDRLMVSVADITQAEAQQQRRMAARVHDVQRTDGLTAMPNRIAMLDALGQRLAASGDAADARGRLALLLVNLDRFERINTRLGAEAGDAVLREIAQRLSTSLRPRDRVAFGTAARLGGDEFVVLLDDLDDAGSAERVAQRLLHTLSAPCTVARQAVHIGISIGVLPGCHMPRDAEGALHDAALAMREAKRLGGGRCVVFQPGTRDLALVAARVEHELRDAVAAGELRVVYQPIVPLADGEPLGVEALVRWHHPQRGLVPPDEFIGIAESSGLIVPLGAFVLETACRQFVAWRRALGVRAPDKLSVNVSRAQLKGAGFEAVVDATLQRTGMPAQALQLEVTESLAAQDAGIREVLLRLKSLGLLIALDDFGTGYSSLSSLHQWPVDVVKIDRSFVRQLETSAHHEVLVEATLMVARSLGMSTVAEGVETPAQAAALRRLRCGSAQGYLYARPQTPQALTAWLGARSASPALAA